MQSECERGIIKEQYFRDDRFRYRRNVRDRTEPTFPPFPDTHLGLLNSGINLQEMYGIVRNGIHIYDKMSDQAKNVWLFDKDMQDIEMIINNVEDYFMEHDKRFHLLATTVRRGDEVFQEYECIALVNTSGFECNSGSSYYTSDPELPFSD